MRYVKMSLLFLVVTLFIGLGILGYSMVSGNASGATYESMQISVEEARLDKLVRDRVRVMDELADERRNVASYAGSVKEYEELVRDRSERLDDVESKILKVTYEALLESAESRLKVAEKNLKDSRLRLVLLEQNVDYVSDAIDLAEANIDYYEIIESRRLESLNVVD